MAINVEIKKKNNENNLSMLKRFNRKVQESGVINKLKSKRYAERHPSDFTKKKNKLKALDKKTKFEELYKLGKLTGKKK